MADLIASSSSPAHKMALNQMRGGFSKELIKLRAELLHITSLLELELDFSEEDVEFADRAELRAIAVKIENMIAELCNSFSLGNVIKNRHSGGHCREYQCREKYAFECFAERRPGHRF